MLVMGRMKVLFVRIIIGSSSHTISFLSHHSHPMLRIYTLFFELDVFQGRCIMYHVSCNNATKCGNVGIIDRCTSIFFRAFFS